METKPFEVYLITAPGYWYIGSTIIGATKRFNQHLAGYSGAPRLWEKIKELGTDSFRQVVVERGYGNPLESERAWFDFYLANDARKSLQVQRPGGWAPEVNTGRIPSEETRSRMSIARMGLKRSPAQRAKMSAAQKGRIMSAEHRSKISATLTGKILTDDHKANISNALKGKGIGRTLSEAHVEAIRSGHSTIEAKANMSASQQSRRQREKEERDQHAY